MKKWSVIVPFTIVLLILAAYLLWPSDEARIKKLFKDGARALEKKDLDAVMSKVSYNYHDDYGMTYLYLRETLKREFTDLSEITVEYEVVKILVKDKMATADVKLRILATAGNETGYILGDIKTPVSLRFTLEKERTKWQVAATEMIGGIIGGS